MFMPLNSRFCLLIFVCCRAVRKDLPEIIYRSQYERTCWVLVDVVEEATRSQSHSLHPVKQRSYMK